MREASVNEALARLTKHMQTIMILKDKRRTTKRFDRKPRPVDSFHSMPMAEEQLDWAIGHNLQWVLSIIQPNEGSAQ
jgi:hypothetical protein